ncbi:zinc-binding dehydrogenase [Pseudonocardia sp. NPDC049635]|uniref:zinc-binding dehydrogenase n=1 Tax=Pseudonocardia sp. NPDC049635 TaxID=3155506 RepID=UPI0033DC43F1
MDGEPGPDEVLVDVGLRFPGPGHGLVGTVTAVGPGVDPGLRGRPVVTRSRPGRPAVRVVVAASAVLPEALGPGQAAALVDDAATALRVLAGTPVRAGEDVLVVPAADGPGALLVRLVTDAGARVVAAAHGAHAMRLARELGAVHVVDHGNRGWVTQVHELLPRGPAVVFDGAGGLVGRAAAWLVAQGGRYTSYGTALGPAPDLGPCEPRARGITVTTSW